MEKQEKYQYFLDEKSTLSGAIMIFTYVLLSVTQLVFSLLHRVGKWFVHQETMPVAGPQDAQLLHYLLQSKPAGLHSVDGSISQNNCANETGACGSDVVHRTNASASSSETEQYFSTNSPPLLNLSPNLSPTFELQRTSPFYDLRETTRRRGYLGELQF